MVILYDGGKTMRIGKRVNHMIFISVSSRKRLWEKRELLLLSTAQLKANSAGNKIPHGLETTYGSHENVSNEEEFIGDEQASSDRLSWWTNCKSQLGIGPNKTRTTLVGWQFGRAMLNFPASWKDHTWDLVYLLFFPPNFVECLLNGECVCNTGLTETLLLKPEDCNSFEMLGICLSPYWCTILEKYRLV